MKLGLVVLLVSATLASVVEKHYHYHLEGMNSGSQRALLQMNPDHKGFFSKAWCRLSNWKRANVDACNAKNEDKSKVEVVSKAHLMVQKHMIQVLEHKLTWRQSKCWSLYFWSKTRRQPCLDKVRRLLNSEIKELNVPMKHRSLWGNSKCFTRFMFNKAKRQECYDKVKADELAKKNNKANNVATPAPSHLLVQTHMMQVLEHKLTLKQSKCWSLYFWSKVRRQACLNKVRRLLNSEINASNVSQKHRSFWGNTKCFTKFMFNKTKRQECYNKVKADNLAKKNSQQASK